jgi:hypothetical protein
VNYYFHHVRGSTMDAYVFIRGADGNSLSDLRARDDRRLRLIVELTGPEDAFVAIEGTGLRDVREAIVDSIRGVGLRDSDTSIAVKVPPPHDAETDSAIHLPTALRRWLPFRTVEAYARVRAERGRAKDVYDHVHELPGYLGHALVAGRSDLIVGMGGDDFDTVANELLDGLHDLDGVRSTETSFAFNEG